MSNVWVKLLAVMMVMQLVLTTVPSVFAQQSPIKAMNTTAGQPALIMLSGEPNEVVELTITNPFHSIITQSYQLNDRGFLQYWYPQAIMAGEYVLEYKDQITSFTVLPALPDAKKSQIEFSDFTSFVGSSITGKLSLKDYYGNLVTGRPLELKIKGSARFNCSNACRTNQQGLVQFSISSEQAGMKTLSVIDSQTNSILFQEDLGFIPHVRAVQQPSFFDTSSIESFVQPDELNFLSPREQFDYIPLLDPTRASLQSQGNDDRLLSNGIEYNFRSYLPAQLLEGSVSDMSSAPTTPPNSSLALSSSSGVVSGFQVIFGVDKTLPYREQAEVEANKALDFILRAVDAQGNTVPSFTGDVKFSLDPAGPLIPADYTFKSIDQGEAVFELALVMPAGQYAFSVEDKSSPNTKGTVTITARLQSAPVLNNTTIALKVDSPIANSVYSSTFAVQGSTNTDNTEIVIREGTNELKRGRVDGQKNYNFPMELSDGRHQLEISATYLVDGSQTKTTVDLEIDQTPPVITSINVQAEPVRAGELFQISAVAEANSVMKAFINNRAYDFVGVGNTYTLSANAPLDEGDFPVNIQIADRIGNSVTSSDVGILKVIAPLQEIQSVFGIPGVGTMTLAWDPTPGATLYEIRYQSVLGSSTQAIISETNRKIIDSLVPEVSYVFTIIAKDAAGNNISLSTDSTAYQVLSPPVAAPVTTVQPVTVPAPEPVEELRPAAEVQTVPVRHAKSGPEVYLLILLSVVMLNLYGRVRKFFVELDT